MTDTINFYLNYGFDKKLTTGKLVLLKKNKEDHYVKLNKCRTIQVNSVIVKVLEKVILGRMNDYNKE